MENIEIAKIFYDIANLLEIKGENAFRIRSYRNAALSIEGLPITLKTIAEKDEREIREIPGIGKGISEKIIELLKTGKCTYHRELLKELPSGLLSLLDISGLGPKKVKIIYEQMGISSVDDLEKAARAGKLRGLPGMGEKTEANILKSIDTLRAGTGRFGIAVATNIATELVSYLEKVHGVARVIPAGSLRRARETVGDVDILVACNEGKAVMEKFVQYPEVSGVLAKGPTKTSVVMKSGLQVDVRVLEERSFGAALQYFTGSKAHNVAVRDRAKKMGLKISEYGVFREKDDKWIAGKTEEDVYEAVGLKWIPPELRENRGEVEASLRNGLPELVTEDDIRGDLHVHTKASDGGYTIEEMARYAVNKGYDYIAITDHSKAVGVAHGLDEKRLLDQMKEIDKINDKFKKEGVEFRVLKGTEVDIRMDGSLDLDPEVLSRLDVVVGAVHSGFTMPEDEMTKRIEKALSTGLVDILAHPSGRLINKREPYKLDMAKLFRKAKEHNAAMEINAYPARLDLSDINAKLARDLGVMMAVSTDSHNKTHMENIRYGIANARRGWLEKKDILNTRPLGELLEILQKK